ncbi:MAG: hypothetical protein IJD97_10000 [Clostridia bacterium]|nr:hypothetical protein [Clostridia bacterium]
MDNQIIIKDVISEFKRFLNWETQSFDNWETVDIFIAETLSEAWILARPYDEHKFLNKEFKKMVDSANGKWLEKADSADSYKIILSTKHCDSIQDVVKTLVHEMRHCLDYQNSVKHLSFDDYHSGNRYYNNWSEFRAVYSHTRYEFFTKYSSNMSNKEVFDILAEILGKNSSDSVTGLIRSENDLEDTLYYLSRYIGGSRAVRNINLQSINAEVFHLWTLTPQYIIENFGSVFYIGNEWDETEVCELDAVPKTYYYPMLVDRLAEKQ